MAAVRAVVVAEHAGRALHRHAGGVRRHADHALPPVALGVRIGHAHHDQQLAPRGHRAGRPPLAPADHVVIAVPGDAGGDVGGVRGGDPRLGHRERRADLPVQQRVKPPLLLLRRAEQ